MSLYACSKRWQAHLRAKNHLDGPREEAAGEGGEQLRAHFKSARHVGQAAQLRPGRLQLRLHLLQQLLGIRHPRARALGATQGLQPRCSREVRHNMDTATKTLG